MKIDKVIQEVNQRLIKEGFKEHIKEEVEWTSKRDVRHIYYTWDNKKMAKWFVVNFNDIRRNKT